MLAMRELRDKEGQDLSKRLMILWVATLMCLAVNVQGFAASEPWTPKQVVDPATLARELKASGEKPLLLHVGFPRLYDQAHIPGSKYCGPAFQAGGIAKLEECVKEVPHMREIVLYCGCCPWAECPNIRPAFEALRRLGFTRVRVLYLPDNFGQDWTQKGYPTEP
jgi:thiosulfate/3-mercaptopyruvate sulfurtransferase